LEDVVDPTGAGDTFAGGLLGHLAETGTVDGASLRRAVLHGTVCASFAVEQFSVDGIAAAGRAQIERRYQALLALIAV
jgi:sugar/nucleoside kinase (ribokinase family)